MSKNAPTIDEMRAAVAAHDREATQAGLQAVVDFVDSDEFKAVRKEAEACRAAYAHSEFFGVQLRSLCEVMDTVATLPTQIRQNIAANTPAEPPAE